MSADSSSPPSGPRGRGWWSFWWRPIVVLVVAGGLGWWILRGAWFQGRERTAPEASAGEAEQEPVQAEPERVWQPREAVEPAPGCRPEAERRCVDGDVWWVDSCGVTHALAQECGNRLCAAGQCEAGPPGCNEVSIVGRCDGEVARGCAGGWPYAVDCATRGQRCVTTEEGAICRAPSENACDPLLEPSRCDGDTLVACVDGERQQIDCRAFGGLCGRPPGARGDRCVALPPPLLPEGCEDACHCEPARTEEVCNGVDDDQDGFIDEHGCEPVDLVLFVIVDDSGEGSYTPDELDAEVARLGRAFAREDDYGLEFRVAEVVRLAAPQWLELDDEEIVGMLESGSISPARDDFYVPVVLTERLFVHGVPRPGMSTVPNGYCGDQRRSAGRQPVVGLVVLAKQRWTTTLAHELGHFFGLCHTHADHPAPVVAVDGAQQRCAQACTIDDDGLCDTPYDPGPGVCAIDLACSVTCPDGSAPDPGNMMGYYPDCRQGFTEQQALLMRRSLALRRGWHRCAFGDGCACELGPGSCPEGMSCRRYVNDAGPLQRCSLDGPALPGGVCTRTEECSQGALCIGQPDADSRCVRPCDEQTPACRCLEVSGVSHPICVDDLRREESGG